ncbi:MAG: hypothetical protein ACI9FR_001013 [Cryomorphaceae bacterium]|jgi:hypothetical protein
MAITWNDLTVDFEHLDANILVEDWRWLVGEDARLVLISSMGDIFFQQSAGAVYSLLTGSAEYQKVAKNSEDFQQKLSDDEFIREWFVVNIVSELKEKGMNLEQGMLYGFKQLPVLGGLYHADNFELIDIEVHLATTGQINYHIKDLPDGTEVKFDITD